MILNRMPLLRVAAAAAAALGLVSAPKEAKSKNRFLGRRYITHRFGDPVEIRRVQPLRWTNRKKLYRKDSVPGGHRRLLAREAAARAAS